MCRRCAAESISGSLDIIEKYFEIIKSKIGTHYKIGIYGTGEVCYRIKQERKYAEFSWLGQASGGNNYGGYSDISKYNIKQLENTKEPLNNSPPNLPNIQSCIK